MAEISREQIEALFGRWRVAIDHRDFSAMRDMLTPDARGGNAVFGVFEGRESVLDFAESKWPKAVPNDSVWYAIDGSRLVNKWKETLPGDSPSGGPYEYFGISEFLYDESDRWRFMYGLPDVPGLMRAPARWKADGFAAKYPDVYPEMA